MDAQAAYVRTLLQHQRELQDRVLSARKAMLRTEEVRVVGMVWGGGVGGWELE